MIVKSLYSANEYRNFTVESCNTASVEQIDTRRNTVARKIYVTLDASGEVIKVVAYRGSKRRIQGSTQCQEILREMILEAREKADKVNNRWTLSGELSKGMDSVLTAFCVMLPTFIWVIALVSGVFFKNTEMMDLLGINDIESLLQLPLLTIVIALVSLLIAPVAKYLNEKRKDKEMAEIYNCLKD